MKSIISFPDRGPWGDGSFRGNCSGHVQRELIEHFKPKLFIDVCEGSGTSRDICRELGVEYVGLDLHQGFDFTTGYVLAKLPRPADLVFSHPPYGEMIDYREVGRWEDPEMKQRDLSAFGEEAFLELSRVMLLNQREAVRKGGIYATLIGDLRSKRRFRSFQADYIQMMPRNELVGVVIKAQHNCASDRFAYHGRFIPIQHEYLLIWEKKAATLIQLAIEKAVELKRQGDMNWRSLLRIILVRFGGQAGLREIYREVEREVPEYVRSRPNWMAKVRQQLQYHFEPVSKGVWQTDPSAVAA